jgi:hypothetical protein
MLSGVEIWNRKYDGVAPLLDAHLLATRDGLSPLVSLDFHNRRQFYPLALTLIDGGGSRAAIVRALRAGAHRPEFAGVSALRFTSGPGGAAVRSLERARKRLRRPLRRLERIARSR